jgi:hypothetical protein
MMNSFCSDAGQFARAGNASQFIARIIVPGTTPFASLRFSVFFSGNFCQVLEPVEAMDVSYSGTSPTGRLPSSIRSSTNLPETFSMTITAAHVPAIVALLAGVLILIMPRFLNFIVAIYLILVGLHGLGFLRVFHM